jgi:hypothetical protein
MKIVYLIVLAVLTVCMSQQDQSFIGKQWVMVGYERPGYGFYPIPVSDYVESCNFKWTICAERKGRFVTTVNDKFTFKGTYKLTSDDQLEIHPKINQKIVDVEKRCHVDTESRIILGELLEVVTDYSLKNDTLIFKNKSGPSEGVIKFVLR